MQRYEYKCKNKDCEQKSFDVLKTNYEDSWEYCPLCGTKTNERKDFYQINFMM